MRRGATAAAAVLAAGVLLFVVLLVAKRTDQAFTLGASKAGVVVQLIPRQEACEGPFDVPPGGAFDSVRVFVGTYAKPGPPMRVTLKDGRGRVVARPTVRGYADERTLEVPFGRSFSGRGYTVCFRNQGDSTVAMTGNGGAAVPASQLRIDGGEDIVADLSLSFGRPSRSVLSSVPDVLDHARLFRSPRLSGAVYGLLLVLLLAGAGWGLVAAVRSAEGPEDGDAGRADAAGDRPADGSPADDESADGTTAPADDAPADDDRPDRPRS
jgi:hypothetical protein